MFDQIFRCCAWTSVGREGKKRHGRSAAGTRYSDTGRTDLVACSAVLMRLSAAVYAPLLGGEHVAGPYSNGVLSLPPDTVSFSLSHSLSLSALSDSRLSLGSFPRRYEPSSHRASLGISTRNQRERDRARERAYRVFEILPGFRTLFLLSRGNRA